MCVNSNCHLSDASDFPEITPVPSVLVSDTHTQKAVSQIVFHSLERKEAGWVGGVRIENSDIHVLKCHSQTHVFVF